VVTYTQIPINDTVMLFLGFPLGFSLSGIFSGMGAFLSELFPTEIRAQVRASATTSVAPSESLFPDLVGYFSKGISLGEAIGILAGSAYLIVVVAALLLPETRGKILGAYS
jgi:hypothetical protein